MIKTGLTSVTFRTLKPTEIVTLVEQAGLQGIEWGGDIHVPHGDISCAQSVYTLTSEAGLEVSSYGSYYLVGSGDNPVPFEAVLETAVALHAPVIRVWAGDRGSEAADQFWWHKVIEDSQRISFLAEKASISLSFEFHEDTLTDTSKSALKLLQEINRKNFRCYWQPPMNLDFEARLNGLEDITRWLSNIHVFHYSAHGLRSLAEGEVEWSKYISIFESLPGDHFCLLEFVKDDSVKQFIKDAQQFLTFFKIQKEDIS
jgi:3-dehydroshikimate dehydratase